MQQTGESLSPLSRSVGEFTLQVPELQLQYSAEERWWFLPGTRVLAAIGPDVENKGLVSFLDDAAVAAERSCFDCYGA